MDDEKLISLVQERDELYNRYNPVFKSVDKKAEAWLSIATEMGMTAEDCMKRWTNLRDRFTRETKRADLCMDNNMPSTWPYLDMMQFIKPHVTPRPIRSTKYLVMNRKLSDVLKEKSYHVKKRSPPPSPTPSIPLSADAPEESQMECADFTQINNDPLIEMPFPQKNTFTSNPDVDKSFCEAVEALKRACAINEARHKNPAVHAFGEMIVSTICSMNSRNQLKAMQQVTDVVMKIKLQEDELSELSYPKS